MLCFILHLLGALMLLATAIMLFRQPFWWVRIVDGERLQVAIIMLLVAIGLIFSCESSGIHQVTFFLLLVGGAIFNLKKVIPFTPLYPVEIASTNRTDLKIRLLACNVRTNNRAYSELLKLIEEVKPDLILLTETDKKWLDAIQKLKKEYPFHCLQPQENTYGMALYSKFELQDSQVKFLVESDIPSIYTTIKLTPIQNIQFIGLHPRPPAPWTTEGNKDLELIYAAGATNWNTLPTIVSGDLNDVGWSPITQQFKGISGLLDPRIGRGLFATYNVFIPFFRVPIDHFFLSDHFKILKMRKLRKIGSDHFPVMIEINLEDK